MSSWVGLWATAPSTPHPPALVTAATTSRQCEKAKIGRSMPTRSVALVRMGSGAGGRRSAGDGAGAGAGDGDGQLARPPHLAGRPRDGVGVGQREVGEAGQPGLER